MKKLMFSVVALGAIITTLAHGYNSPVASDPKNENFNVEYKYIVKSAVAGESGAIAKGDVLTYASAYDGYTVTKMGGGASVAQQLALACVAAEDIATGDSGYHRCVTRGYINYVKYNATIPFSAFGNVCVNSNGVVEGCTGAKVAVGVDGVSGTATAALGRIIPLQTKSSGTGSDLKAIINIP
jgi:hypothetical protein